VQDDCISVALGLPQLRILKQKELESYFEVTVIYRRGEVRCPRCGRVTHKEHDRRRQKVEEYLDKLSETERVRGVAMDMHEPFPSGSKDVPAPGEDSSG